MTQAPTGPAGLPRANCLAVALLGCLVALMLAGCSQQASPAQPARPLVVGTSTMLCDAIGEIGGDAIDAGCIMKPGGDPHLYQPRPSDAALLARSTLVVTNGLRLEGWIDELVRNAGGQRPIVVAGESMREVLSLPGSHSAVDPHFWFDVPAWSDAMGRVGAAIAGAVPEAQRAGVLARTEAYRARLARLDAWTRRELDRVPRERRVLITSHDAFRYFGRAYGVEVVAIQGVSTEQEASQRDVARVVDLVRSRGARAVFVETSVNPSLMRQVAAETGVRLAGPLFSDSVGPEGSPGAGYVGMVAENIRMIVDGLGATPTPFDDRQPEGSGGVR